MVAGLAQFRRRGGGSTFGHAWPDSSDGRDHAVPAIEFRDVHLWFDEHKVLDGLSFKVMGGETRIILGGREAGSQRSSSSSSAS